MGAQILLVASEWWPSKGGVSSFNMELAYAAARERHEVHCVVRQADDDEIADARDHGVTLHSAIAYGVVDDAPFHPGFTPDLIVGHDRWTGHLAARWRHRFPTARLALLLHVHPGQIDGLKTEESVAARNQRIDEGRLRIQNADVAFGVGEQLASWWGLEVPGEPVSELTPGLPTTLPDCERVEGPHHRVLLLGRAEDAELKGVHVAARAMRGVADRFPTVELVVRGVTPGTEAHFEKLIRDLYPKPRRFTSREYDASREQIASDLAASTVVLQPSLEEGFGLVTLEAVYAGVPVLTSSRSGVARVLEAAFPRAAELFVVPAGDHEAWRKAIETVLDDLPSAKGLVKQLRNAIASKYSWNTAAAKLVREALATDRRPPKAGRPGTAPKAHFDKLLTSRRARLSCLWPAYGPRMARSRKTASAPVSDQRAPVRSIRSLTR
jgi:glycosyltransferase involved in cell wall biosynthesis